VEKKSEEEYKKIALLEKAITQKYGQEAIKNPKSCWDDEKEKKYLEQLKESYHEEQNYEGDMKIPQENFLVSKRVLEMEREERVCPICKIYSFKSKDDVYMLKYGCCYNCFLAYKEGKKQQKKTI